MHASRSVCLDSTLPRASRFPKSSSIAARALSVFPLPQALPSAMLSALRHFAAAGARRRGSCGLSRAFSAAADTATPPTLLSTEEVASRLAEKHPGYNNGMYAFYSSVVGGITTDPASMVVPLDDRMVHRGHAVFDTANVKDGKMYGLDFHIDRLLASAESARIDTAEWPRDRLRHLVLHTAAASGARNDCFVRYWLSSGRGMFGIVPEPGRPTEFYAISHFYPSKPTAGIGEALVSVPMKPPLLANIKSNNYLLNALTAMEAQEKGGLLGVQTDADGFVTEQAVGCIAIVDKTGVLRTPPFDKILRSTTLVRSLELVPELLAAGALQGVEQADMTVEDIQNAAECFGVGGGALTPIVRFNGKPVGTGEVGPASKALSALLDRDLEDSAHLDDIPYEVYGN